MAKTPVTPLVLTGPLRAAIYGRVSTDEQADRNMSIPAQIRGCGDFALREGMQVVVVFEDAGYSGTLENRPALQAMLKAAARGEFDVLIVHKMDRLSRDEYFALACKLQLKNAGVRIRSVTEPFVGGEHPAEQMMEGMMRITSAFYINNLKTEIRKGHDEAARQGRQNGQCPYGYDYNDKHIRGSGWKVIETEAQWVRLIFRRIAEGNGLSEVTREVNSLGVPPYTRNRDRGRVDIRLPATQWSRTAVRWIARNRAYTGKIRRNGEWLPGAHEAIISTEEFDNIQQILDTRPLRRSGSSQDGLFVGGFLRCPACDAHTTHTTFLRRGRRFSSYVCSARHNWRQRKNEAPGFEECPCDEPAISQLRAVELLTSFLRQCSTVPLFAPPMPVSVAALPNRDTERESIQNQLQFLRRLEDGYIDMVALKSLSTEKYEERMASLRETRTAALKKLDELSREPEIKTISPEQASDLLSLIESDAPIAVKRDGLRRVIDHVTARYSTQEITIFLRPIMEL